MTLRPKGLSRSVRAAIVGVKSPVFTQDLGQPVPASDAAISVSVKCDRDAGTVFWMPHLKLRSLGEDVVPDCPFLGAEGKLYVRVREHRGNRSW
jgi:hypothetical protein